MTLLVAAFVAGLVLGALIPPIALIAFAAHRFKDCGRD